MHCAKLGSHKPSGSKVGAENRRFFGVGNALFTFFQNSLIEERHGPSNYSTLLKDVL